MPYPTQITPERILERAAHLIETHGADAMSLHQLAADLGVKTPSLYRYYAGKADLLRAINLLTTEGLIGAMQAAAHVSPNDETRRVLQMARAYRRFAHARPRAYELAFGSSDPAIRPDETVLASLAQHIQDIIAPLAAQTDSLTALRGLWALLHGFVMIELAGQFQRGGDLDAAYETVVRAYIRGLLG